MKFKYEISKLAIRDLNNIWNYTYENWSKAQANQYHKLIFKEIDRICKNPEIGKSISDVKENHRIQIVKTHLVVYKLNNEVVYIDRILHQKMNFEDQITE